MLEGRERDVTSVLVLLVQQKVTGTSDKAGIAVSEVSLPAASLATGGGSPYLEW